MTDTAKPDAKATDAKSVEAPAVPSSIPVATGSAGAGRPSEIAKRDENTIPQGAERGSTQEILGGDGIVPDGNGNDTQEPQGLQAEPALFVAGGEVPINMLPSPSGPVPVGSVARDAKHAEQLLKARKEQIQTEERRSAHDKLSDEQIDALDGATARAIMETRGYDLPRGAGGRTAREALRSAQADDARYSSERSSATPRSGSTGVAGTKTPSKKD